MTTVSLAASAQEASTLLDKGDWQAAASMAADLISPDGFTVAARATALGPASAPRGPDAGLLEKAQGYANQAIKLNPGNAAAYFELSRADGRLAQFVGILQSLNLAADMQAGAGEGH